MENVNCRFQREVGLATVSPGVDGLAPEAEILSVGRRRFLVPGGPAPDSPTVESGAWRGRRVSSKPGAGLVRGSWPHTPG